MSFSASLVSKQLVEKLRGNLRCSRHVLTCCVFRPASGLVGLGRPTLRVHMAPALRWGLTDSETPGAQIPVWGEHHVFGVLNGHKVAYF